MMGLGFGFIWMLLVWGGLIVLAVWLIRVLFPSTGQHTGNDNEGLSSAQDILNARYANGELTTEEYQEMSREKPGQPLDFNRGLVATLRAKFLR